MSKKIKNIIQAVKIVIKSPKRLFSLSDWEKFIYPTQKEWVRNNDKFKKRVYKKYEDYILHQRSKLDSKGIEYLSDYDKNFHKALYLRLKNLKNIINFEGKNSLCLAARIGTEVRSFIDMGCFAIGIDLNPGTENKYVLTGDFHNIQFPKNSADIIYTNSLDHVYDIDKLIGEIVRVLKMNGIFILELFSIGTNNQKLGTYECFQWERKSDIIHLFTKNFILLKEITISTPWIGTQIILQLVKK